MALCTQYVYFEYQMMPFRLFNTSTSFQGYINKIMAKKVNIFLIIYLNDILIYIKDPSQSHVAAVQWVLDVLRKYDLFANFKKWRFHKDEICFFGYVIST